MLFICLKMDLYNRLNFKPILFNSPHLTYELQKPYLKLAILLESVDDELDCGLVQLRLVLLLPQLVCTLQPTTVLQISIFEDYSPQICFKNLFSIQHKVSKNLLNFNCSL